MEFAELLAQAKPAERTVRLCLRGDLVAEFEDLERQLAAARAKPDASLACDGGRGVASTMETLRARMEDYSVTFRVRALPRRAYQALVAAHPPRRDTEGKVVPDDAELDADSSTFWFALARVCLVDPVMDDTQWERLVDQVLSDRQFELLALAAFAVCRGAVDVPFSFAASELLRNSGGGSSAPNGSASPCAASTGGSLATPPSTTTGGD